MQKKRVVLVLIAIFLVLAGIGGTKKVIEMRQEAQKERQIAFLKAHEKEMTEYVKKQDEKISRVAFIWNTVKQEKIGNGLPQGVGKILTMRIKIFDNKGIEINAFGFALKPDDISNPTKIKEMYTINAIYNYFKN
ncbi:MAG TPA: hypothetical protein DCR08_02030 [Lactobacillus sp.]|nr:hypothetical protein [Lactobacillus sp.]